MQALNRSVRGQIDGVLLEKVRFEPVVQVRARWPQRQVFEHFRAASFVAMPRSNCLSCAS